MTHYLFEQLYEAIINHKSDYGSQITEDELYQKVLNTKFADTIYNLGVWLSPERDLYSVFWHEPFIKDVMTNKYKNDPNKVSLMKQLNKDFYGFAFDRGWVRLNITKNYVNANGNEEGIAAMREYLSSLSKQLDRELYTDIEE
jgi:hypothetical protein